MSEVRLTVVLPIYNGFEHVEACLQSLLQPELDAAISSLILVDDASPDPRIDPLLRSFTCLDARIDLRRNQHNLGYLQSVNNILASLSGAVILLNSDTRVGPGWATRLHAGAQRYPRLGALTPLSNNATFSTLPGFPGCSGDAITASNFQQAELFIAERRMLQYPLAPTGMGFCLYLTPLALRISRGFDPQFAPGYEEENDLCMKLRAHGLQCRIATDVLVFHAGGASFGEAKLRLQNEHYKLMQKVHPTYDATVKEWFRLVDTQTQILQGIQDRPLRLLLDGEILGQTMTGVVRYMRTMLNLCRAAAQLGAIEVFVVVNDQATADAWRAEIPDVRWITYPELRDEPPTLNPPYHIYHVFNANISLERILVLRQISSRFVFTLHDLIAFENPSYWASGDEFLAYRQRLRTVAQLADCVLCISEITASEAQEQLGVQGASMQLFSNPLAHLTPLPADEPRALASPPLVLVVGTDFRHKNLLETVRLFADALLHHPSEPRLVLAGPEVSDGGTLQDVHRLLEQEPQLAARVDLLGPVTEVQLQDLYRQAVCCLYLSLQEGFGYIPYEAARYGCPTLVSNTSVYNGAPVEVAVDPYSCEATRERLVDLVDDSSAHDRNVQYWLTRLQLDHQRPHAEELLGCYQHALNQPRDLHRSFLADLIQSNLLSSSSLVSYQLSFKEAARQLGRRGVGGVKRRARAWLRRLKR